MTQRPNAGQDRRGAIRIGMSGSKFETPEHVYLAFMKVLSLRWDQDRTFDKLRELVVFDENFNIGRSPPYKISLIEEVDWSPPVKEAITEVESLFREAQAAGRDVQLSIVEAPGVVRAKKDFPLISRSVIRGRPVTAEVSRQLFRAIYILVQVQKRIALGEIWLGIAVGSYAATMAIVTVPPPS